jgi:hypothetical protein
MQLEPLKAASSKEMQLEPLKATSSKDQACREKGVRLA